MNTLEILSDSHHDHRAYLNGTDCFAMVPFDERVLLWQKSIALLEEDVMNVAESVRSSNGGAFAWCFTWENHRNDGVLGTIYYYYLLQVIAAVVTPRVITTIRVEASLPTPVYKALRAMVPNATARIVGKFSTAHVSRLTRPYLGAGKLIIKLLMGKIRRWRPQVVAQGAGLLQSGERFSAVRFNRFLSSMKDQKMLVFSANLFTEVDSYPQAYDQLFIPSYLTGTSILQSLRRAILFRATIQKQKRKFGVNIFFQRVKAQSFLQNFLLQLKDSLFERAMIHVKPSFLAVTASLADPVSRLPVSIARRLAVPSVMIACRSMVSDYRPEDRACEADLQGYNNTHMGDFFLVRDNFSRSNWVRQGISAEKIMLQSSSPSLPQDPHPVMVIEKGIILLFTQYDNNTALCKLVASRRWPNFKTIFIRSHPNKRKRNEVGEHQWALLHSTGLPVRDISDIPMTELTCEDCVAFVVNSTSGVEIVSTGSGVVWFPFISEHSLQFYDAMNALGKVCHNKEDFDVFSNTNLDQPDSLKEFVQACERAYRRDFAGKDDNVINWSDLLMQRTT